MKINTEMKVAEYQHYVEQLTHYPINLCLMPAIHLALGNSCLQDLALAVEYYNKYITSANAVTNEMLEQLKSDIPLIEMASQYIHVENYRKAKIILNKLDGRLYGVVFRMKGIINDKMGENVLANASYLQGAQLTDSPSAYILGAKMLEGRTPEMIHPSEKDNEAASYFAYAAKIGHNEASIQLAHMYENAIGIEKNIYKALDIYQQLLAFGHNDAQKYIDRLNKIVDKSSPYSSPKLSSVLMPMENLEYTSTPNHRRKKAKQNEGNTSVSKIAF